MIGNIGFVLFFVVVALFLRRLPDLPAAAPVGSPAGGLGDQPEEQPYDHLVSRSVGLDHPGHEPRAPGRGDHGLHRPADPAPAQTLTAVGAARVTPQILARARMTLTVYGFKVTRIKTNTASLAVTDPDAVVAWTVSKGKRGPVKHLSTRDLVLYAAQAAGEHSEQ